MSVPRPTARAGAMFKVFVKREDGLWRIASLHTTRQEAELSAYITIRQGFAARVMLCA